MEEDFGISLTLYTSKMAQWQGYSVYSKPPKDELRMLVDRLRGTGSSNFFFSVD